MILKQTLLTLSDRSGINVIKVFQLYKGFNRQYSRIGLYIKGSVKHLNPNKLKNYYRKGNVVKAFITRQVFNIVREDSSVLNFFDNSSAVIKKKRVFASDYLIGPGLLDLKKKKIMLNFKKIL